MKMRLRGPKLLARKYQKPPMIGSIHTNPAWRRDNSRSLWEVVESTSEADAVLKVSLLPDWILITPQNSGVFLWRDDTSDEVFLLDARSVRRVIPWTTGETMKMTQRLVLVKPDEVKTASGSIIIPDVTQKRPVVGRVMEIGPDVTTLAVGDRALYTVFSGTQVTLDGTTMIVLHEEQILAIPGEGEEVA